MPWWLIVYFVVNLIIAVFCTTLFTREGYYDKDYKTNWGLAILVFIILLIAGLPIVIFGGIVLLFEG